MLTMAMHRADAAIDPMLQLIQCPGVKWRKDMTKVHLTRAFTAKWKRATGVGMQRRATSRDLGISKSPLQIDIALGMAISLN